MATTSIIVGTQGNTVVIGTPITAVSIGGGIPGGTGAAGPAGSAGVAGPTGLTGSAGSAGASGAQGVAGTTGATGPTGSAGSAGAAGTTGAAGAAGVAGAAGATGAAGSSKTRLVATALTSTSGVVAINLSLGEIFPFQPTEAITGWVVTNAPAAGYRAEVVIEFQQHATAAKTVVSPAAFQCTAGIAWVASATLSSREDLAIKVDSSGNITLSPSGVFV